MEDYNHQRLHESLDNVNCTLFVLDLASRRVQTLGSTPHPNALFMQQMARTFVFADHGPRPHHRVLICDRDAPVRNTPRTGTVMTATVPRDPSHHMGENWLDCSPCGSGRPVLATSLKSYLT